MMGPGSSGGRGMLGTEGSPAWSRSVLRLGCPERRPALLTHAEGVGDVCDVYCCDVHCCVLGLDSCATTKWNYLAYTWGAKPLFWVSQESEQTGDTWSIVKHSGRARRVPGGGAKSRRPRNRAWQKTEQPERRELGDLKCVEGHREVWLQKHTSVRQGSLEHRELAF